jgi:hypothetical protein
MLALTQVVGLLAGVSLVLLATAGVLEARSGGLYRPEDKPPRGPPPGWGSWSSATIRALARAAERSPRLRALLARVVVADADVAPAALRIHALGVEEFQYVYEREAENSEAAGSTPVAPLAPPRMAWTWVTGGWDSEARSAAWDAYDETICGALEEIAAAVDDVDQEETADVESDDVVDEPASSDGWTEVREVEA